MMVMEMVKMVKIQDGDDNGGADGEGDGENMMMVTVRMMALIITEPTEHHLTFLSLPPFDAQGNAQQRSHRGVNFTPAAVQTSNPKVSAVQHKSIPRSESLKPLGPWLPRAGSDVRAVVQPVVR